MSQIAAKQKKLTKRCPKERHEPTWELKECFGNSYVLHKSENYEEFLRELGVKTNTRLKAVNSKPTIRLSQLKDAYVLTTSYPEGRQVKVKFKPGKEIDRRESTENPARSVFQVIKNKIIEKQTIGHLNVVTEREFKNKEVLVTMEVNKVKCYRWYTLVEGSRHSISTETSRRSSLWKAENPQVPDVPQQPMDSTTKTVVEKKLSDSEEEVDLCY